jgi:pterin-4a-carbinolamine dehydratase
MMYIHNVKKKIRTRVRFQNSWFVVVAPANDASAGTRSKQHMPETELERRRVNIQWWSVEGDA